MKIAFYEVDPWLRTFLDENGLDGHEIAMFDEKLDSMNADTASEADIVSVIIHSRVDIEALDKMPNVRLITTRSTGFDHIDIAECEKRGIGVANVPRYGENTVAEHAFALILALARRLKVAVTNANQLKFELEGLKGVDLRGKTLGVVGTGAIGLNCIRMGLGFGMNVVAFDAFPNYTISEVMGFKYASLEDLLSRSDVVSLHVPLNDSTYHLINKDNIATMKRGAILVNTARGAVVDTDALIMALDEEILGGAGLDVLEGEESIQEDAMLRLDSMPAEKLRAVVRSYKLMHRDNVIITPHSAFYSVEAEQRIIDTTIENIRSFICGAPANAVRPKRNC